MGNNKETEAIRYGRLLAKAVSGTMTAAEQADFDTWLAKSDHRALYESLQEDGALQDRLTRFNRYDAESVYTTFLYKRDATHKPRRILTRWIPYAAAVVLMATAATWIFFGDRFVDRQATERQAKAVADIQPGGNRATLTLADGRSIDLSEGQAGIVVGDKITYLDGSAVMSEQDELLIASELLSLTTPKSGTYQLTLPDGSQVWLNAASTIKYPSKFAGNDRVVEISGEAYFSVKKDTSRPFKVLSEGQEITVLGTEFNISSYHDDPEVKTTLVEGSVKVAVAGIVAGEGSREIPNIILEPGEQAITHPRASAGGALLTEIRPVNVYHYTAWKDGFFFFKNTPLIEVLQQVSRWYDVEVEFRNGVPDDRFGGEIKRDVTLLGLIEILQVSNIDVTLEGNVLRVN